MRIRSSQIRLAWGRLVAMTRHVPHPRTAAADDRAAQRRARAYRVERLGLAACRICLGATDDVEDTSLRCDCQDIRHELVQRAVAIAHAHRDPNQRSLADVIAP